MEYDEVERVRFLSRPSYFSFTFFGRTFTCVHSWKYSLWLFLFDYTVIYSKFMEGDEGERVCFLRWLPIFPQLHIFGRNFTGVHLWKCSLWLYLVWITKLLRELSKETLTHFCQWAFKQKIRQNNINVYEKAKRVEIWVSTVFVKFI